MVYGHIKCLKIKAIFIIHTLHCRFHTKNPELWVNVNLNGTPHPPLENLRVHDKPYYILRWLVKFVYRVCVHYFFLLFLVRAKGFPYCRQKGFSFCLFGGNVSNNPLIFDRHGGGGYGKFL